MNSVSNFMSEEKVLDSEELQDDVHVDESGFVGTPAEEEIDELIKEATSCTQENCGKRDFLIKLFKYKFELVNMQPDQLELLASAFDLVFEKDENHVSKVEKLCKVMGL